MLRPMEVMALTQHEQYNIREVMPPDTVTALDPGTNVLVSGPPMGWTRDFALELLAAGRGLDGILIITTKDRAKTCIEKIEQRLPELDTDRIGVVDCSGGSDQEAIRDISTQRVGSPGDLTGISIATAKVLQQFSDQDIDDVRHGLVSVSTMLQYLNLETVFKFLHVYTRRIDDTDGLGIFTINADAHDDQVMGSVTGECDGVIDLRERDDGTRELRVRGFDTATRGWVTLDE